MKLIITSCDDPKKWYAGLANKAVPFLGEDDNEYESVDQNGHRNFISKSDAKPFNLNCPTCD